MRTELLLVAVAVALSGVVTACDTRAARGDERGADDIARQDSILRAQPGYVIDSAIPIEEALRRFRSDLSPAPVRLTGGRPTRTALVEAFAQAVERGDSLSLREMGMSRAEFAYLVYPFSRYTRPPYRQQPEITWLLLAAAGDKGIRRLVERRAGQPFRVIGHDCPREPEVEGDNRIWRGCTVRRLRAFGDTVSERLFGPIIERGGRFKFYSYGNEL